MILEWILNTRDTDIWGVTPGYRTPSHRWPYEFITHCCIKGGRWERNAICNTFSEGDTIKLYLDPLVDIGNYLNRTPKLGSDYGS